MKNKSEIQILKIIKYVPPIFIICVGLIMTSLIYMEHKSIINQESEKVKSDFMENKRNEIKRQVDFVSTFIQNSKEKFTNKLREKLYFDVLYNQSLVNNLYKKNRYKPKNEIINIITEELKYLDITNNIVTVSSNPELKNHTNTFFKNKEIKINNISYIKWFKPLNIYTTTTIKHQDFEDILKKELLTDIRKFRFEKDRYVFIMDYDSNVLMHPNKKLEGKNILKGEFVKKRKDLVARLIDFAKTDGGYISYTQLNRPSTNKASDKTSYLAGVEDWSWIIGTGFYHDTLGLAVEQKTKELNGIFKNYMNSAIIISLVLTLVMLLLSIYFSNIIQVKFTKYKDEINRKTKKSEKNHKMLAQQSKMAAIGEMLGNIAHQWRQPLTVISMCANNMKVDMELGDVKEDRFESYTRDILVQTNYLSNTIDDFRNFFKSEEEKSYFTLKEAYNHALKIIDRQFQTKNIEIIENVDNIDVQGVFNEFIQVLINILNNSKDAFDNNKIKEHRYIFIDSKKDEDYTYLYIKDSAGGVDESVIEKVFEPYFTTKHQSQGTGIGLYMSKEIIHNHMKGQLTIENCEYEYNDINCKGALITIRFNAVK